MEREELPRGADPGPEVAGLVGARMSPRRNCLECFERHGFITAIHGDQLEFDYVGLHQEVLSMIRPADVRWAAERMQKLTDKQWHDAFRAANYSDSDANRYLRKLK